MKNFSAILSLFFLIYSASALHASYSEALKLFQQGQYTASLKKVADQLEVDKDMEPNSPNYKLRFLAAHLHWKLGNEKSVIAHFKRCMDIKQDTVDPCIDLALYLTEQKRYGDATVYIKKGLKIKKAPMLFYLLGRISLEQGNYWRAKKLFEKTNALDPELYFSYNALGITLVKLKKYGEANAAFSVAQAIRPKSPEILNNMGISLEYSGKYKKAYEYYRRANSIDMESREILGNLTRVKKKLK